MSHVTDVLRNHQIRCLDPMGLHVACFQENDDELMEAIRSNESVEEFLFDPFVPCCKESRNYLIWCYTVLDACSRLPNLRRVSLNTSHFPLSLSRLCLFLQQAQFLEHLSFGSLFPAVHTQDQHEVLSSWLNEPVTPLLQVLRDHSHLSCLDLYLPDSHNDTSYALLTQVHTLSNLHELRVSFGSHNACSSDLDHRTTCWMSLLLQNMPHLRRLLLRNVLWSRDEISKIAAALQNNTTLQDLHLHQVSLRDEMAWEALGQALGRNTRLQVLVLSVVQRETTGSRIPHTFIAHLTESLQQNNRTALREIHLTGVDDADNNTTSADIHHQAFLTLLQTNTTLQSLELLQDQERNEHIELYLKLNRAGRSQWSFSTQACWNCMQHHDLDCIYTMLQENPALLHNY